MVDDAACQPEGVVRDAPGAAAAMRERSNAASHGFPAGLVRIRNWKGSPDEAEDQAAGRARHPGRGWAKPGGARLSGLGVAGAGAAGADTAGSARPGRGTVSRDRGPTWRAALVPGIPAQGAQFRGLPARRPDRGRPPWRCRCRRAAPGSRRFRYRGCRPVARHDRAPLQPGIFHLAAGRARAHRRDRRSPDPAGGHPGHFGRGP